MRTLIVEDEFISRTLLVKILSPYGVCDVAVDGSEAIKVLDHAYRTGASYDLVCLDIVIPEINGHDVLKKIRTMEESRGIEAKRATKVIMTTVLDDSQNIMEAFAAGHCDAYLTKPIDGRKLLAHLQEMQLLGHGNCFPSDI